MVTLPLHELGKRCETVGLRRTSIKPGTRLPDESVLWTGSYASLLLCPVESAESAAVEAAEVAGQDWLDENLDAQIGSALVDGYLVLALPRLPTEIGVVRQIEQSTKVCRKHVIWPEEFGNPNWHGLEKITVIALPPPVVASEGASYPELDEQASAIWEVVNAHGSSEASAILGLLR